MKFIKKVGVLNLAFSTIITVFGLFIFQKNTAYPSISWMVIFDLADFQNLQDLWVYIMNLRTGIPPLQSIFEILVWLITKNHALPLITIWVYRGSMILSYILAVVLFNKSTILKILSFVTSLMFMYATSIIHVGNPQIYDTLFPCLILLYFAAFDQSIQTNLQNRPKISLFLVICAGILLGNIELMRPFAFIFIPFALLSFVLIVVRRRFTQKWRFLLAFLIPLLIISGGWHLKLIIFNNGQLNWSNHQGINISRLWGDTLGGPALQPDEAPLHDGRWLNINTQTHYENSQKMLGFYQQYIFEHPFESIKIATNELMVYLSAPTKLFVDESTSRLLTIYPIVVLLAFVFLFYQFFFVFLPNLFTQKSSIQQSENILLIFTMLFLAVLCVGEQGEEARFLISMLPLLAAFPKSPSGILETKPAALK